MNESSVGFYCDSCSLYNEYTLPPPDDAGKCEHCGHNNNVHPSPALLAGGPIDRCPQCDNVDFYLRKDFPQQLGCAVVTATVALSSIAYALWHFPAALAVLVVVSIADYTLYHRLSDVTVCYRCHAELRRFAPNEAHGPFDMHTAEEYEAGS
jgi:hypothetical protein